MPKKVASKTVRVHIVMDSDDVERLHLMFDNNIGFSRAIRKIVRRFLNSVDQAVEKSSPLTKVTPDDISRAAALISNVALDDDERDAAG